MSVNCVLREAGRGDVDYLKSYIEARKVSINATNSEGLSALSMAVSLGNLEHLKTLISAGADVNIVRYDKQKISTPVMIAVKRNRLSCLQALIKAGAKQLVYNSEWNIVFPKNLEDVRKLIEAGANPIDLVPHLHNKKCLKFLCENVIDLVDRNTCLLLSSQLGNHVAMKALIQAGADVNSVDKDGNTALMLASGCTDSSTFFMSSIYTDSTSWKMHRYVYSSKSRLACVQALLQAGSNVNAVNTQGDTALIVAIKCWRRKKFLVALLQAGASCNVQNRNGKTALMFVFDRFFYSKHNLKILLKYPANVNIQDNDGKTALMLAVNNESVRYFKNKCLGKLLKHKVDVNIQDNDGKTALMYAAEIGDLTWCQLLIEHTADANIQDNNGMNAIMFAILYRNIDVCQCLIHKSDLAMQDKDGWTALHYACEIYAVNAISNNNLVDILLQAGANVDQQDKNGRTVLMNSNRYSEEFLIKYKANVNIQDINGKTALMHALFHYHTWKDDENRIQLLIDHKADLNVQDEDDKTALMHAVSNNLFECAKILILAGADTELKDKYNCTALVHLLSCHKNSLDDIQYFYQPLISFLKTGVNPVVDHCHRKLLHDLPEMANPILRYSDDYYLGSNCRCRCRSEDNICEKYAKNLTIERTVQEGETELTRLLVCNGVMNEHFSSEGQQFYKSLLGCAIHNGSLMVVKYLFATCFLRHSDIGDLRDTFPPVGRRHPGENQLILKNIIRQAVCQPWPLVKLAFISVSTALGDGPDRQNRVTQTLLPDRLQRMLMFQEPVSRLPVGEWEDIPLTFDPVEYEKLPKPRPLLYYWPIGRDLVA